MFLVEAFGQVLIGDTYLPSRVRWSLHVIKYAMFALYGPELAAAIGGQASLGLAQLSHSASWLNLARADVNQGPGAYILLFWIGVVWISILVGWVIAEVFLCHKHNSDLDSTLSAAAAGASAIGTAASSQLRCLNWRSSTCASR